MTVALTLLCVFPQLRAQQADDEPIIAAEVIVKFAQEEPVNAEINKLLAGTPTASQATSSIRVYVSSLSDKVGKPLGFSRTTSGRELVLGLRRDVVLAEMAREIRSAKDVTSVEVSLDEAGSPVYRKDELIVAFDRCSDSFKTIAKALSGDTSADDSAIDFATVLLNDRRYAISARLLPDNRLGVGVDWKKTTLELVKELNERPEVQYAQPSFVMRTY